MPIQARIGAGRCRVLSPHVVSLFLLVSSLQMKMFATSTMSVGSTKIYSAGKTNRDAYALLASAISERMKRFGSDESLNIPRDMYTKQIANALRSITSAQGVLKNLDGAAFEAYQRTHGGGSSSTLVSKGDGKVSGRATRSARRAGCAADALFACELCELISSPELNCEENAAGVDGTLEGKEVLINTTIYSVRSSEKEPFPDISVLVLYEAGYNGGAGLSHGGIDDILFSPSFPTSSSKARGRLLIIVKDNFADDLSETLKFLDSNPFFLVLSAGLVAETASVHEGTWKVAGQILEVIRPVLSSHGVGSNSTAPAIHFVGHSIAGGVAGLAATILDGSLPFPESIRKRRRSKSRRRSKGRIQKDTNLEHVRVAASPNDASCPDSSDRSNSSETEISLHGFGKGRTSAIALGPPPSLSPNVRATFVTSVIYGDDIVSRMTRGGLDRLCQRTDKNMKGGFLGKRVGWMADTVALTATSIKSHAHGSEGEETKLAVAGNGYLVRPRRLGGISSMHEIGGISGREALRAAMLWQLGDILLSRSLWAHHSLISYLKGLDRVQLRSFVET